MFFSRDCAGILSEEVIQIPRCNKVLEKAKATAGGHAVILTGYD